jgi:hypothetical protein
LGIVLTTESERGALQTAAQQVWQIDGVIDSRIAVEISSGQAKYVNADASGLAANALPFKLLIVVPVNQHDPETAAQRARNTFGNFACRFAISSSRVPRDGSRTKT